MPKGPEQINRRRETAVERLCIQSGALAVVAIYDGFTAVSWHPGANPQDLRHDLVTAGNYLRESLAKKHGGAK